MSDENTRLRIAELRKKKGYTQSQFADKMDRSVETISNYERGKTGKEAILLVIKMCQLLECNAADLLEEFSASNQQYKAGNMSNALSLWWQRVFPKNTTLGGKEIDGIIDTLKTCIENVSDEYISSIFCPDNDLEQRFRFLISDFESDLSRAYDTKQPSGEIIHKDPDICACIFCYLKTENDQFLNYLTSIRLRRFVRKSFKSGSPSYLTYAMESSDLMN